MRLPDLTHTFTNGPGSALNPFLRFDAVAGSPRVAKAGGAAHVAATSGHEFTY